MEPLDMTDKSILIAQMVQNSSLTIGVPHHTPGGTPTMPCSSHRDGDENAGFIGRHIADALQASFVCACNYFIDPNKSTTTDYYSAITRSGPTCLIEIHGHGKRRSKKDVEISCGSLAKEHYALELKSMIDKKIRESAKSPAVHALVNLDIEANFSALKFSATQTVTMQDDRWLGFHIELAPNLRIDPASEEVPPLGLEFADVLIGAIKEMKLNK